MWQRAICPNKSSRSTSVTTDQSGEDWLCYVCVKQEGVKIQTYENWGWCWVTWRAIGLTSVDWQVKPHLVLVSSKVFYLLILLYLQLFLRVPQRWCVFGARGQNVTLPGCLYIKINKYSSIALLVWWRRHSIQPGEDCVCSKCRWTRVASKYLDITFFFICGYVLLYVMYINKGKLSHKPGLTLLVVKNYFCWTTMQKGWYFTNSWKTFHINLIWLKLGKNKKYPIWQYFFLKLQGIHQEMIFLL